MGKKPPPGFNTPFRGMPPLPKPAPKATAPAPQKPAPPVRPGRREEDDRRAFEEAMRGVTPLSNDARATRRPHDPGAKAPPRPAAPRVSEDALAEAELADLIESGNALAVEEVGESVAAVASGIDRRVLKRLRAGQFPVDAELDLHGRLRERAREDLLRFVARARDEGKRCVLVIHGRGLGSGPEGAVLPAMVRETLAEGPLRRHVLAFTSAPPAMGGDGALIVLLRRRPAGR
jgi:DNA-nicking Smr family endonuclease